MKKTVGALRDEYPHLYPALISGLTGLATACFIALSFYRSDLKTVIDWTATLSLLTLGAGYIYFFFLPTAWGKFKEASQPVKRWALFLTAASALSFSFSFGALSLIPFLAVNFILISPALSPLHQLMSQKQTSSLPFAWILGGAASFFATGFFQNFFPSGWEFVLIVILLNGMAAAAFTIIIEKIRTSFQDKPAQKIVPLSVMTLGFLFFILTIRLLLQYPTLFSSSILLPASHLIPAFFGLTFLSPAATALLLHRLDSAGWQMSPIVHWIKRHLPGLLLASAISASTYLLATVFVKTDFSIADNYFDTDSPIWVNFLTADSTEVVSMRAVHPYVLMLLRPPVWLLSLLLNGNKFHAALLLNAFVGGVCIFLTWLFFKQRTKNTTYALLIALLLGLSNSHLLLSTFLESYIFSAAALITSVLLLQDENVKLSRIVPVGLVTFGITITNFIQTGITFLLTQWDLKRTFKYGFITLALATMLTFAQTQIQPNSRAFYVPANLISETPFARDTIGASFSKTASLANVLARTFILSSVVTPRPFITTEEGGCAYPCFYTIRIFRGEYQYASYIGFGSWLARSWFVLLVIAGLLFAWSLMRSSRKTALQAALVLNLLFNFVLHMNYGDDPMLYSPNWTYALVFFFGLSFERLADRKWVQAILLIFLTALLFNNFDLFHKMLDTILPVFG